MRPKLNLKDKSQMSKPNDYTDIFKSNSICIFPSVRAKLKKPLCPRTLCTTIFYYLMPYVTEYIFSDFYTACFHLNKKILYMLRKKTLLAILAVSM